MEAMDVTLFSGATHGTEAEFGRQAEAFGAQEVNYSFEGHVNARIRGLHALSREELITGDMSLTYVSKLLNRNFTFGKSTRHAAVEGMRYSGVGIATSLLNYLVYSGLLVFVPELRPVFALTIGSAVATIFSYTGYAKLVFGR